jgi:hypothetical protein
MREPRLWLIGARGLRPTQECFLEIREPRRQYFAEAPEMGTIGEREILIIALEAIEKRRLSRDRSSEVPAIEIWSPPNTEHQRQ